MKRRATPRATGTPSHCGHMETITRLRGEARAAVARAAPVLVLATLLAMLATPAAADFRLCNNTGARVGIALGYKDADGWTTEGWWNLSARSCDTLLRGQLVARFYYV